MNINQKPAEVVYIRKDQLAKARISPYLCDVGPQDRDDKEPIYTAEQVREAVAADHAQWAEYLKEGQTPFERFMQERKDLDALLVLYGKAVAAAVPDKDSKDWCDYVAVMIGGYLNMAVDAKEVKAISGIMQRRVWALKSMIAAAPEVKP